MKATCCGLAAFAATLAVCVLPAAAQMQSEPFSFRGSGPGMSNAARQAILQEQLTGATPRNLLRGPGDQLLSVEKGPGSSAIVRDSDGVVLPGFRGTSALSLQARVGIFNAFFLTGGESRGGTTPFNTGSLQTRSSLASWTGMVGGGAMPATDSPVDAWTNQVFVYYGL